jgi:integrase
VAYAEKESAGAYRARFKRPDGTLGSKSGFSSARAAEDWGNEQEALIRRNLWIDNRDSEMLFGVFVARWFDAVVPRLERTTASKYLTHINHHLLPQWQAWPLISIFNSYVEIEKWVSELHEDYADSTVASVFATFSTVITAAVRARMIPASPCAGIRVTSGGFETERLIASPVQVLRAAMRLYRSGLGARGFLLCVLDAYTGGRWGELAGQQRHEYDGERRALVIQYPLKEVSGKLFKYGGVIDDAANHPVDSAQRSPGGRRGRGKQGRTKTPAGTRTVELPPSIAVLYEEVLDSHHHPFVLCTPEGMPWRRSNFRQRYWRPAWDGTNPDQPYAVDHSSPVLRWFTFHEGRHTHATWLTEDGIPEIARRARLGQKMKGIARVYDHVTPVMRRQILDALEARWWGSLAALTATERAELVSWFPHLRTVLDQRSLEPATPAISIRSPFDH